MYKIRGSRTKQPVSLFLKKEGYGVSLCCRGKDRKEWYLLQFHSDGTISKYAAIQPSVGLPVNENGELIICSEGHWEDMEIDPSHPIEVRRQV